MFTGAINIGKNSIIGIDNKSYFPIITLPYDIPKDYPNARLYEAINNYVILKYYFTNEGLTLNIEFYEYGNIFNAGGIKYYYCIFG